MISESIEAAAAIIKDSIQAHGVVEMHLDVESTSLRGVGFAFALVIRQNGMILGEVGANCASYGEEFGVEWVHHNVLPYLDNLRVVDTLDDVYRTYWMATNAVREGLMEQSGRTSANVREQMRLFWFNGIPVEAQFEWCAMKWAMARDLATEFEGAINPCDILTIVEHYGYKPRMSLDKAAIAIDAQRGIAHNPLNDVYHAIAVLDAVRAQDPRLEAFRRVERYGC